MTITAQFEIYSYTEEGVNTFLGDPPFSLPTRLKYMNKVYIYMDNPSAWVESQEYSNIINSHNIHSRDYDLKRRLWVIYDALDEDTVIELLITKLISLNGSHFATRDRYKEWIKKSCAFPTLYAQAIGKYEAAFKGHVPSLCAYLKSLCDEVEV